MPLAAELRAWGKSFVFASTVFCLFIGYMFAYYGSFSILSVSAAVASTAAIMIGVSFALSGICYYSDFLDKEIYYRKYIGLIGYFLAVIYTLMLPLADPDVYLTGIPTHIFSADYILGLCAMAILTMMALISNKKSMVKLGAKRWRELLHLGYVAYALLIVRAYVLEKTIWEAWIAAPITVPPPRLIISVFATLVILLKISVLLSKHMKEKKKNTSRVATPPAILQPHEMPEFPPHTPQHDIDTTL